MRFAPSLSILACGLLSACASGESGPPPEVPNSVTRTSTSEIVRLNDPNEAMVSVVKVSAAEAWSKLPAVYQMLGLGGKVIDESQHTYGNERVTGTRINNRSIDAYFRCGSEGTFGGATRLRIQLRISTTVAPATDGAATVTTAMQAFATPAEGTSTGPVLCASNGALEQEIMNALKGD